MTNILRQRVCGISPWKAAIVVSVVLAAAFLGLRPSQRWMALMVGGVVGITLLIKPVLGLPAVIVAALVVPLQIHTGTAVVLNAATLLVPALLLVWLVSMLVSGRLEIMRSRTNRPLLVFVLAGLLSLLVGNALWDPAVPRSGNFTLVQLAQWAIFAFAAGAFWLTANLVEDEVWLRRVTFTFLALGGALAMASVVPGLSRIAGRLSTIALARSPFWMVLAALAGGQLLFNDRLWSAHRIFLGLSVLVAFAYAFVFQRQTASNWVSVGAVLGVLAWLRWPRLRHVVVALLIVLASTGFLSSTLYEFAGGEAEWAESGGSRLLLIGRVVEVTMRNPLTGLGPASYRPYANMEPLKYYRAFWVNPNVSSHNNYVDLFAHTGILGLGLFSWFAVEVTRLGLRLRDHFTEGFAAGYVNGMLAAGAGALVLMLFADWILPFVYNIGFPGFQASVLVWLFLGGFVSLEQIAHSEVNS